MSRIGVVLVVILAGATLALLTGCAAPANAAQKALLDTDLEFSPNDSSFRRPLIQDASDLGARWVRITARWAGLEPSPGAYDQAEIQRLDALVDDLAGAGIRVLLGVRGLPGWAQDRSYSGNPGASWPIRADALDDLERFGEFIAGHYGDRVRDVEVWNEPNMWIGMYPQRTASDGYFAARTYLRMLKAFHAGAQRGDPDVRIVAGATAPIGLNDRLRTSPQRFAGFLKRHGASAYFDVYSHHPYTPGGTVHPEPDGPPNDPSTTVTLYNLRTLLRLFPTKPFYLTEYGYNTVGSVSFGGFSVSEATQARYLRTAYRLADKYSQVKMLMWFLVRDDRPAGMPAEYGMYSGLRRLDGTRKPSWFVYAGGNRVSLLAPERARRGSRITIQGRVTCASIGGVPSRKLVVLGRRVGTTRWYTQATVATGADGRYSVRLPFRYAAQYRVKWSVVRTSIVRTVRAR